MKSRLDKKVIWSKIKDVRLEYLIKNIGLPCEKKFIPEPNIISNFEKLSHLAQVKNPDQINFNLSKSDINVGAEMFMFLNGCPTSDVRLYWKVIYGKQAARTAALASNIIQKGKQDFKIKAVKIFAKICSVLGFQHIGFSQNDSLTKKIVHVQG